MTLCRICQEHPAFDNTGVCRWESCEREAQKVAIKLDDAIKSFRKAQHDYADYGAGDTEPDTEFEHSLMRAYHGTEDVPTTADAWQLYHEMKCGRAAKALSSATRRCVRLILKAPMKDRAAIRKTLEANLWRLTDSLRDR